MNYQQNYHYSTNSTFSYVKKEDAKALLKNSRYLGIIFGFAYLMLAIVLPLSSIIESV